MINHALAALQGQLETNYILIFRDRGPKASKDVRTAKYADQQDDASRIL